MPLEIAKEWFSRAEEDYLFASSVLENTKFYPQLCFHFQQAAEKYLKALIIAKDLKFRPIHNLVELLAVCKGVNPLVETLDESCKYLNPFYIDTRYPVHWPTNYDKKVALKAQKAAVAIREVVKDVLD